jgi:hypothetical protein
MNLGGVLFATGTYSTTTGNPSITAVSGGKVGIGAVSPSTTLEIGSSDLGNGTAGPIITLGRNTNGTATGAGSINFLGKAGTAGYVWQDAAGNMRINTTSPSNANDTAGTVIGAQTSTRDTKTEIMPYTDYAGALAMVTNAPLNTFRYIKEVEGYGTNSPLAKTRIGFIADEVDPTFMVGNVIDQVSVNGLLMASIKEMDLKVKDLDAKISGVTLSSIMSEFFGGVVTSVSDGVAYIKGIVVDTLKVGSPEKRTGITLYDEITGNPYCISIAGGVTKTTPGECGIITPTELTIENTPVEDTVPVVPPVVETLPEVNVVPKEEIIPTDNTTEVVPDVKNTTEQENALPL